MTEDRPKLNYIDFGEEGVTGAGEQPWDSLPSDLRERIEKNLRSGVTLGAGKSGDKDFLRKVASIHWRPGPGPYAQPNELAAMIIKHVKSEMELELDGHYYLVRPHPDPPKRGKHRLKAKDADR